MVERPEENEPLTVTDRVLWHVISALVALPIGVVAVAASGDRIWVGVAAGAAWIVTSIILARLGFWDMMGWLAGWLTALIVAPFKYLAVLLGALLEGIVRIGAWLIGLVFVVFVVLGIIGLLWFGIRQIF